MFHQQKAQPGEGTYADLGEFHQAAPSPPGPLKKPPPYAETEYAEITQFLKGPVETNGATPKEETGGEAARKDKKEETDEAAKKNTGHGLDDDELNDLNGETNAGHLYPSVDQADGENEQAKEFVLSI